MVKPPTPPFIQAKHYGGYQNPDDLRRIVIHSTVSSTYCGGARAIASYFQNPTYVSSAHYAIDPCEVIQMVNDWSVAWHDGTNDNSLGLEMCEIPSQDIGRWNSDEHQALLTNTADLTRQLCLAYGVPIRKLTPAQIRTGERGICGHDDMAAAYPNRTSHWDPGAFPWDQFMNLVGGEAPINAPEDDDMTPEQDARLRRIEHELLGPRNDDGKIAGWDTVNGPRTVVAMLVDIVWALFAPIRSGVAGSDYEASPRVYLRNADAYGWLGAQEREEIKAMLGAAPDAIAASVADKLGMTTEQVKAAFEAALEEALPAEIPLSGRISVGASEEGQA